MSNILLNSLYKYYDEKNIKKLLEVLEEDTKVSLRIIDWFVTNYSKKHNIFYTIYKTETGKYTFIFITVKCYSLPPTKWIKTFFRI